jgi:tetratricopeptide (TPR) repeat protein
MLAIAEIREKELKLSLQKLDQGETSSKTDGLIARYRLIQSQHDALKESFSDYIKEERLMALLSASDSKNQKYLISNDLIINTAYHFVNIFNFMINLEPLIGLAENKGTKMLEIAYFYERKRNYSKAISIYDIAEKYFQPVSREIAYIYLHKGFCSAILGKNKLATINYQKVINSTNAGEMTETAQVLLSYIFASKQKEEKIKAMPISHNKGIAYYKALSYTKAVKVFNEVEKKNPDQKLYFYRGRSHEELGKSRKAIKDYKKSIEMDSKSVYAKQANRRLYILGAFYENNKKIKEEAKKKAVVMGDSKFIEKSDIVENTIEREEVVNKRNSSFTQTVLSILEMESNNELSKDEMEKDLNKADETEKSDPKDDTSEKTEPVEPPLKEKTASKNHLKKFNMYKFFLEDGSIFEGEIIEKTKEYLTVETPHGTIKIFSSEIQKVLTSD